MGPAATRQELATDCRIGIARQHLKLGPARGLGVSSSKEVWNQRDFPFVGVLAACEPRRGTIQISLSSSWKKSKRVTQ
jgi:hypothetical protein